MRPIVLPFTSVNQRLPSGPAVMPKGSQPLVDPQLVGRGNSVTRPAVVMRPIWLVSYSVNQRLPSCPAVMPKGKLLLLRIGHSVKITVTCACVLLMLFDDGIAIA